MAKKSKDEKEIKDVAASTEPQPLKEAKCEEVLENPVTGHSELGADASSSLPQDPSVRAAAGQQRSGLGSQHAIGSLKLHSILVRNLLPMLVRVSDAASVALAAKRYLRSDLICCDHSYFHAALKFSCLAAHRILISSWRSEVEKGEGKNTAMVMGMRVNRQRQSYGS
eukprot:4566275-Amphidinium_carterae.1